MQVIDTEALLRILHDFYNLTGIKTCFYDATGKELCFYPKKYGDFCALLRNDPQMNARCEQCDKQAFAVCKKMHKQYLYTCHAGLQECISPILQENEIVGYIVIGQAKSNASTEFFSLLERLPSEQMTNLQNAYARLPAIDSEKLLSATRILDACTGYERLKTLAVRQASPIDLQMDKFIRDRLNEELSVPLLCSKFHLSHSELYAIFKEYFDSTPADYIKKCRLSHACKLLKETALPVHKIATRCGIPDYNYFSKVFKRAYGTSPREYRRS